MTRAPKHHDSAADPSVVDFGFSDVPAAAKDEMVRQVFDDVSPYYDRMNDALSAGLHRLWKRTSVFLLDIRPGQRVLDIAAGSGDMSALIAPRLGAPGQVLMTDINADMLARAAARLNDAAIDTVQCSGEHLPFADRSFDRVVLSFGLRNMTHRNRCLSEIRRVLKTGGKYGILEFSPQARFAGLHRWYLTRMLPRLGRSLAGDADSYRYLGESILRFPPPAQLVAALADAGLPDARLYRFAAGAAILYHGTKRN